MTQEPDKFQAWLRGDIDAPLPSNLSLDDWEGWGKRLRKGQEKITWKVAHWIAHGERVWGETYHQAAEATGFAVGYLRQLLWVFNSTSISRRYDLTVSYHSEVAALEPEDQKLLLAKAHDLRLERNQFRALVKEYKKAKAIPEPEQPQWSGGSFGATADMTAQEAGEIVAAQLREHAQKPPDATETGDSDGDVFSQPADVDAQAELAMAVGRIEDLEKQVADLEAKDAAVHVQGTHLVSEEVHLTTYSKAAMMAYEKLHPTLPRPAILEEWARFVMRHLGLEIRG